MTIVDLVIKEGKIATSSGIFEAGLAINDGKIFGIAKDPLLPQADKVIDLKGKIVMPGVIDGHVHVFIPGWIHDTFETGTKAAAVGGVTTIVEMPALDEWLTTSVEMFRKKREVGERESVIDFALYAGEIQEDKDTKEIKELVDEGAVGFKITMGGPTAVRSDEIMYRAMEKIAKTEAVATVHAENHTLLDYFRKKVLEEGVKGPESYSDSRPNVVEEEAISRAVVFAKSTGCRLHIAHMSTKEGVELVKNAKNHGLKVTAEVCPHHLLFSRDDYKKYGVLIITNPPSRSREDVEALWEGLARGIVDIIVTDHCAYYRKEKYVENILDTPPGIPGLETSLTLMLSYGVNRGKISLERLVDAMCERPAKIFRLYPRKGCIAPGSDADLVIVDLKKEGKITTDMLKCIADFTPFEGWPTKGEPVTTIVRGQIVAENWEVIAKPGYGQFIKPIRI